MNNTVLSSVNLLLFRKKLLEVREKLIMTTDDKITVEKLQYYNMILADTQQKISVLSSGKIDKYECFTGEEILPYDQYRMIEKAKFIYF